MGWEDYLDKTAHNSPSLLLKEALSYAPKGGEALDLGAGTLYESYFLSSLGYKVTAIDSNPAVIKYLKMDGDQIDLNIVSFEEFLFPNNRYAIVNARYSLPFNKPSTFESVCAHMISSLEHGGVFVGQLFGPEDAWSRRDDMNFHTKEGVASLFVNCEIHKLIEKKATRPTASGQDKFWHVFDIIASKSA